MARRHDHAQVEQGHGDPCSDRTDNGADHRLRDRSLLRSRFRRSEAAS